MKDLGEVFGTVRSNRSKLETEPGQDMEKPPGQISAGDCGSARDGRALAVFQGEMQGTPNHAKVLVVLGRRRLWGLLEFAEFGSQHLASSAMLISAPIIFQKLTP